MTYRRVVIGYYCYRSTTLPGFTWPVLTLFLLARDLTYTEIAIASVALAAASVLSEVPTGYLADRFGRYTTLLISACLFLVAQFVYVAIQSLVLAVAAAVLIGVAESFQSGSLSAWLYDTLGDYGASDRFTHVKGRGAAIRYWSGAAMMLLSGPLFVMDHRFPFYAMALVNALSVSILLVLPILSNRNEIIDEHTGEESHRPFDLHQTWSVIRGQLLEGPLKWFILYSGLLLALIRNSDTYIQPIAVELIEGIPNGGMMGSNVPPAATIGVLYAAFTVIGALTSDQAETVEARLGPEKALLAIPVAIAATLVLPLAVPAAALPAFFLLKGGAPIIGPIRNRYINDRVPSTGRATVLSVATLCFSAIRIPIGLGAGFLADMTGPFIAVGALAGLFLLVGPVLFAISSLHGPSMTLGGPAIDS